MALFVIFIGTENVISACEEEGVTRLVHTSTIDVVIGSEEIFNGDEANTPIPDDFLFPGYPLTKYKAEVAVLAANGRKTASGLLQEFLSVPGQPPSHLQFDPGIT